MNGWIVKRQVGNAPPMEFKFSPRSILKGGAAVTVSKRFLKTCSIHIVLFLH